MINRTRGDGTKVRILEWDNSAWFEPIYKSHDRWYGLMYDVRPNSFYDFEDCWEEWTPPKQTNKVKLYRPIRFKHAQYEISEEWSSCKNKFPENSVATFNNNILGTLYFGKIVGWQEMEVEVDE